MDRKNSLRWYKIKEKPRKESIYDGSYESTLLFKARSDSLEVNEKKRKWGEQNDKCEKCNDVDGSPIETLEHVLIECKAYKEIRNTFEEKIKNKLGEEQWERKKAQEDKGMKTILGLTADGKEIVEDTKQYLKEIWRRRKMVTKRRAELRGSEHNYTK